MNSKKYFTPTNFYITHYQDFKNTCFMTCANLIKFKQKEGYLFVHF